jgi:hypothetical protein
LVPNGQEEHRLHEQAKEVRKALFSEQQQKEKVEESRATAEADLVCEREGATKLRNAKAALEKEIQSERKKRKTAEEDKIKVEEELRRLKGAANREVEKRREQEKLSVEIEELNKQLVQLKLNITNKKEKLKVARKEMAILAQREKERLVDEDASYYATPDFNKLDMDELLRPEEHYLSSLRVVGRAKASTQPRTTAAPYHYSMLTDIAAFVRSKNCEHALTATAAGSCGTGIRSAMARVKMRGQRGLVLGAGDQEG